MILITTQQARAELAKRRKRRGPASEPPTGAHAAADGAMDADEADEAARKAYTDRGATAGPGRPMTPGQLRAQSLQRPYISEGHAANSPESTGSDGAPVTGVRHIDLTNARGVITPINLGGGQ